MANPRLLGKSANLFQHFRYFLFDDRIEEVSYNIVSAEVTRLFFDEATYATVQRRSQWVVLLVLVSMILLFGGAATGLSFVKDSVAETAAVVFTVLLFLMLGILVYRVLLPPYSLILRAEDQVLSINMPKGAWKRERTVRRLVETVQSYQAKGASDTSEGVTV